MKYLIDGWGYDLKFNSNKNKDDLLASEWGYKFKEAMLQKTSYTKRWLDYNDAYKGDYFKNINIPDYRSDLASNYIFSVIETIRPIMLDNDPKFQSIPIQPEGTLFSNDLQEALTYEWNRENMNIKLYKELINVLVCGTSVFFIPWDATSKEVRAIPVSPFNIFPDPLATSVDDAEYIMYASYKNVEFLKRVFPDKQDKLSGSAINYSELVNDNDKDSNINNQVLVLEVWTRNYETFEKDVYDKKVLANKYPNGRVLTICPELGIILDDKENPYKDSIFPFVFIKDYDLPGKFWGEGEVAQLLSPQRYINDMNNSIIDNAKTTANMPWIIDKNAGVPKDSITARPGLIIRKNPGSEIRREQPPSMPMYVINAVETLKRDVEQISGIYNTIKGDNSTGVYTAQGILALQEAGQVRIRLKVKLLEESLGKIANMWYSRMKQFWKGEHWINVTKPDGTYEVKEFSKDALKYDFDIKLTAGSTMPVNRSAMLDLMIRLAQTQMPDGQPLVDREAVIHYLPQEVKSTLTKRMSENKDSLVAIQQSIEELGSNMQQIVQEVRSNDEQIFGIIEDVTASIEKLNKEVLELSKKHDSAQEERKRSDAEDKIKKEAYNSGYSDAEQVYYDPSIPANVNNNNTVPMSELGDIDNISAEEDTLSALPNDILQGLETLSDEELSLLLEENPELIDLIQ